MYVAIEVFIVIKLSYWNQITTVILKHGGRKILKKFQSNKKILVEKNMLFHLLVADYQRGHKFSLYPLIHVHIFL